MKVGRTWLNWASRWFLGVGIATQIYEGTNQIQRLVMARQLLAGKKA